MILQEIYRELGQDILPCSSLPDPNKVILQMEFYRYASTHHSTHAYIVDSGELSTLRFPLREDPLILLVACPNGHLPIFSFPENYCPVFIHASVKPMTQQCFKPFHRESARQQIDSVFRMGEKAHLSVKDLLSSACMPLSIGVCLFKDSGELVLQDCADTFFQAYLPNGGRKDRFLDVMIGHVRTALSGGSSPCHIGELCYEFTTFSMRHGAGLVLAVFYDSRTVFDFTHFARLTMDYVARQSTLSYTALDQPGPGTSLRQILDGTLRDYPAIADILYGAEQEMKGYRILQIQPARSDLPWGQWASVIRTLLRNAFEWVHVSEDGTLITALLIAKYPMPRDHTETKNASEPLTFYKPGWDQGLLSRMLQESQAESMLSAATSALDMIPLIHEHTKTTLDIASKLEAGSNAPRFWLHTDYLPYLPLHYGIRQFQDNRISPKALGLWLHPETFRMLRNDVFEGKDLSRVLYSYLLSGMDVGEVAQRLYMHRNTVYARLKSIEAFTGHSLKESIYLNCFLPSLRLYYYCRQYLNIGDDNLLLLNTPDSFTDNVRPFTPASSSDSSAK